jgi:hypothetical protein
MHNNCNSTSTSTTLSLYVNRTFHLYAGLLSLTLHVILTIPKCNQITRIAGMLQNKGYIAIVSKLKKEKKKAFQHLELKQNGLLQAFILLNL